MRRSVTSHGAHNIWTNWKIVHIFKIIARNHLKLCMWTQTTKLKISFQVSWFLNQNDLFSLHWQTFSIFIFGFGFTSFCLWRFELSQSILIHCLRIKVNNEVFSFVKTTPASSVYRKTLSMHTCYRKMAAAKNMTTQTSKGADTELDFWLSIYFVQVRLVHITMLVSPNNRWENERSIFVFFWM